jgi:hypothetical protein
LYVPNGQALQYDWFTLLYPALQTQSLGPVLPGLETAFTSHARHTKEPGSAAYVPASHKLHVWSPVWDLYLPDSQGRHTVLFLAEKPASHVQLSVEVLPSKDHEFWEQFLHAASELLVESDEYFPWGHKVHLEAPNKFE